MDRHPSHPPVADALSLTRMDGVGSVVTTTRTKCYGFRQLTTLTMKIIAVTGGLVPLPHIRGRGTEGSPHDQRAVRGKAAERQYPLKEGRLTAGFMRKTRRGDPVPHRRCRMTAGVSIYSHVQLLRYKDALYLTHKLLRTNALSKLARCRRRRERMSSECKSSFSVKDICLLKRLILSEHKWPSRWDRYKYKPKKECMPRAVSSQPKKAPHMLPKWKCIRNFFVLA